MQKDSQCCAGLICADGDCAAAPECTTNADCDDANPCTIDTCNTATGTCLHTPKDCGDSVGCTVDACDPTTGQCLHTPNDAACVLPTLCQIGHCDAAGGCTFVDKDCNDGIDCTMDFCDPTTGACVNQPNDDFCSSSDPCLVPRCDPTQGCVLEPRNCDDGNACTIDSCDSELGGCVHVPDTQLCNDGLVCTTDFCIPNPDGINYTCQHVFLQSNCGPVLPACASYACGAGNDCIPVFDDSKCTGGLSCQTGVCTISGCVYENACTRDQCSPPCDQCICQAIPASNVAACIGTCGV